MHGVGHPDLLRAAVAVIPMRNINLVWFAALSLALVASCSQNDDGGAACSGTAFFCVPGSGISCSDAGGGKAQCVSGQWQCTSSGWIPASQCKCSGAPPPGCSCSDTGWACSDAGAGGHGGSIGGGGSGGGTGGPGACGDQSCGTGEVCVRHQTQGGPCFLSDGGCPPGRTLAGQCCVADPVYGCVPRPSACVSTLTCACAAAALCNAGQTCTMPSVNEIDCTLLAP